MKINSPLKCDLAVIGLGVMGQNLALNFIDHNYTVAGFDLDKSKMQQFKSLEEEQRPDSIIYNRAQTFNDLSCLLDSLSSPKVIVLMLPAGELIDQMCESLLEIGLDSQDIIVDCGNSQWTDTIIREKTYKNRCHFFCTAVSGGEVGARFGPSLMPSGSTFAWQRLKPMWQAIAAKVDVNGKQIVSNTPGEPNKTGTPCTQYLGENGAGHYIKMVHNGIEYADMQLICESYQLLRQVLNYSPKKIGQLFEKWNKGKLNSYLIEISADILQHTDVKTGKAFVDVVLDSAGQKGTGRWTAMSATDMGIPAGIINEAVFARALSTLTKQRNHAESIFKDHVIPTSLSMQEIEDHIENALYCAKICTYAQGFQIIKEAKKVYDWDFDFADIAKIWRGGCIIRAQFLHVIAEIYQQSPDIENLLISDYFSQILNQQQASWRHTIILAAQYGVSTPSYYSALAYFDGYRKSQSSASLLQAQRDYFGAHTYQRNDALEKIRFHTQWQTEAREEVIL